MQSNATNASELDCKVKTLVAPLDALLASLTGRDKPTPLRSYGLTETGVEFKNSDSPPWSGEWGNKDNY